MTEVWSLSGFLMLAFMCGPYMKVVDWHRGGLEGVDFVCFIWGFRLCLSLLWVSVNLRCGPHVWTISEG